ncbi:hypothetical protein [Salipaludibacillus sp. CF4.18]|uniref:hypothetical protein n=1 Tax=Salipaludibacillus sp. CF4.18 TaxID=3373081 RepID=UPI003EE60B56
MQPHFITNLLGIKDAHVHVFDSGEEENGFWFELYTTVRKQTVQPVKQKHNGFIAIENRKFMGGSDIWKACRLICEETPISLFSMSSHIL